MSKNPGNLSSDISNILNNTPNLGISSTLDKIVKEKNLKIESNKIPKVKNKNQKTTEKEKSKIALKIDRTQTQKLTKIEKSNFKRLEKQQELENGDKRQIVVSTAIIRPTGLLDPIILLKPIASQVDDILEQVRLRTIKNERVLITTMTKKFAEELDLYFKEIGLKSAYIHSEIQAMERIDILADLRRGRYDVLIGINLLREGLDLPEVSLVAIMDADKEGFLRSKTSLIQIIGRAARHSEGTVIMYADKITYSMQEAIRETECRRQIQIEYNQKNGIVPKSTIRHLENLSDNLRENIDNNENFGKSGASLGAFGFEKSEDKNWQKEDSENNFENFNNLDSFKMESAYGRREKPKNKYRGGQIFDTFDAQKSLIQKEIENQNLTVKNLKKELKTAITKYEFEKAAAIKEILEKSGN